MANYALESSQYLTYYGFSKAESANIPIENVLQVSEREE